MARRESAKDNAVVVFPGQIRLPESEAAAILESVPGPQEPVAVIFGVAQGLLEKLAHGGIMLRPETVARINDLSDGEFSEAELPGMIEKGMGLDGGATCGYWKIDPAYVPALQEIADMQGRTIQELVQDTLDQAMDNGWAYEVVDVERLVFHKKDQGDIAEKLGAFNNGSELANTVRGITPINGRQKARLEELLGAEFSDVDMLIQLVEKSVLVEDPFAVGQ